MKCALNIKLAETVSSDGFSSSRCNLQDEQDVNKSVYHALFRKKGDKASPTFFFFCASYALREISTNFGFI